MSKDKDVSNELLYDVLRELRHDQRDMQNQLQGIHLTLQDNTESLKEHMKRTDTLERYVLIQEKRLDKLEESKKAWAFFQNKTTKTATFIAAIAGAIVTIYELIQFLK